METYEFAARKGGSARLSEGDVAELEGSVRGRLVRPGQPEYEPARRVWNGMIDRAPRLVLFARGAADVAAGVRFAADHGVQLSVRGGGHNVAGKALSPGGLTLHLGDLRHVSFAPEKNIVRAGGGALLGDIDHETHAHGRAVPLGLVSETGVGGLALHGGIGWLTRRYGMTLDNFNSLEVVTADGRIRVTDETRDSDLFWALRGGGGGFGAVTSFEFRSHPLNSPVFMVMVAYSLNRAVEVLPEVARLVGQAPEELGLIATLLTAQGPDFPEEVQGTPVVLLLGCYFGPQEEAEEVTLSLRSIRKPAADLSGAMAFVELQRAFDPDYPQGARYYWKSVYVDELSDELAEALATHARERPSPLSTVDVWFVEGAPQRVSPEATAFYPRRYRYMLGIEANWERAEDDEANIEWARAAHADLKRFSSGAAYLNFPGFGEDGRNLGQDTFGPNWERLKEVKRKYDPEGLFPGIVPLD